LKSFDEEVVVRLLLYRKFMVDGNKLVMLMNSSSMLNMRIFPVTRFSYLRHLGVN